MSTSLPRFSTFRRLLCLSLVLGAAVDFLAALLLVAFPDLLGRLLTLPLAEPFYLQLLAVVLVMLGAFYLLAAYDPASYSGNILVAITGRGLAGMVLILAAWRNGLNGLYVLAGAELFFAMAHATFWWPTRR